VTADDAEMLICGNGRCGRAYDPEDGEDEIFCSEECRVEDADESERQTDADPGDLPDVEVVAALVHESWLVEKRRQGVTSRLDSEGREQMVPYGQLTEAQKELDRATVRAVYAAIEAAS
jgi:hypothetical protein